MSFLKVIRLTDRKLVQFQRCPPPPAKKKHLIQSLKLYTKRYAVSVLKIYFFVSSVFTYNSEVILLCFDRCKNEI